MQAKNSKKTMSREQVEEAARLFGILADSSRLELLKALMTGEKTVGELVDSSGLGQANVSKHLSVLRGGGFVDRRKLGNFVLYRIADPTVEELCELMCGRMAREAERISRELGAR
jgi:DNA-binding transcriptional ArsR family regulator